MFLSTLLIDTGTNPDRPRPGRLWLRNVYRVHQRLCMAFPSKDRRGGDEQFLKPYDPAQFAQGHVHVERDDDAGFLFRVDPLPGGGAMIVVLSAIQPDWGYAFHNARHLLAAEPAKSHFLEVAIECGKRFRFRLLANAVKRARRQSMHRDGKPIQEKWAGKRIGINGDEKSLRYWIDCRAGDAGFAVEELTLAHPGYAYASKTHEAGAGRRLRSVRYEGMLKITDADKFRQALAHGIGPAKAFGFGLLSIAPAG
jgi:CRISPR system Cascade subunit CasE